MAHVLGGDAKRMHNPDTSVPVNVDFVSHVSPNAIPACMQQSRGIVGISVNIVRRKESSRKDFVGHVAGREHATRATQ